MISVAGFTVEIPSTVFAFHLRFEALRFRFDEFLTVFSSATQAKFDVVVGLAAMLTRVVVALKAVRANIIVLSIPLETCASMIMIIYVYEDKLLLVWVMWGKGYSFVVSSGVDDNNSILG